jgi:hypothetical protein
MLKLREELLPNPGHEKAQVAQSVPVNEKKCSVRTIPRSICLCIIRENAKMLRWKLISRLCNK